MPDMLVSLLTLPPLEPIMDQMRAQGVLIRRAHPFEITPVRSFIQTNFLTRWADEVLPCYSRQPISLFIAVRDAKVIGFAAYETVCRDFFGPTGVAENERGKQIGTALLVASLWGLREMGYAYGIIGGAGPTEFYEKAVGAVCIPDSVPGIYSDLLDTFRERRPEESTR
jgi:hypothetical protein